MAYGAAWGVTMWSVYGLVEFLLFTGVPVFREGAVLNPVGWRTNAMVFGCYWILGALFGALTGALVNKWCMRSIGGMERRPDLTRFTGSLSLLVGLLINLVSAVPLRTAALPMLGIVLALASATVWAMLMPKSRVTGCV